MNTTVVRSLAPWLLTLAVGAAGVLGCNPAPPEARPAAPRDPALGQQTATANGEAFQQDRRKGPRNAESAPQLPPGVPAKVTKVLKYIDEHHTAPEGQEGGRTFGNYEGQLPKTDARGRPIKYHEWDVNPRVAGKNRGPERLVTGSDGSAYYTADHYKSFIKIR